MEMRQCCAEPLISGTHFARNQSIHYSKKLEEQTFDNDIRFFSLVRILGICTQVLPVETSTSHNTRIRFLTKQENLFHMATPKICSILAGLKNCTSKVCSSNFLEQCIWGQHQRDLLMHFRFCDKTQPICQCRTVQSACTALLWGKKLVHNRSVTKINLSAVTLSHVRLKSYIRTRQAIDIIEA